MVVGYYYINDDNFNLLPKEFVKINDLNEYKHDKPLILIGYLENRDNFTIDIDHSKIENDIFWTFTISEYRDRFNNDLFYFKEYCYKLVLNKIEYEFYNLVDKKYSDIKKLIKFARKKEVFLTDEMIYLINKNKVIGLDINQIDYFVTEKNHFIKKIKKKFKTIFLNKDILIKYKGYTEFEESKYIIPYLIKND